VSPPAVSLKDKIPPHNDDAERAALGAMLLENEAVAKAVTRLAPDDFYSLANGKIFRAIKNISDKGGLKPDIISVCDELGQLGQLDAAGGEAYVSSLTTVVPTAANIDYYVDLIKDNATRRALIGIASKITAKAHDISLESKEILENAQHFIYQLIEEQQHFQYKPVRDVIKQAFISLEEMFEKEFTGVRSGYREIDELTRGFQKSEMIVIGARPSIGKTALALNMAANIAFRHKIPTGFFSLEMDDSLLVQRFLAAEASVDLKKVRTQIESEKARSFSRIQDAAARIYDAPLFIEDVANMKLLDLRTQSRHLREKEGVEIIFVDYLGLINNQSNLPRYEQVSEISRSIKGLARELKIPIVVLSQLGRTSEGSAPSIAHLRDSGSIEQDADVVMLLHRDQRGIDPNDGKDFLPTSVEVAKNRNGPTGKVTLAYYPKYTRFERMDTHG
jgi:replicative DNA helicase